jgi:hypothetical protein
MRHGGITGFEVKIGRDGGIFEPGTGPSNLTRLGQGDKTIHEKRQHVKCWQFFEDILSSSILFNKDYTNY